MPKSLVLVSMVAASFSLTTAQDIADTHVTSVSLVEKANEKSALAKEVRAEMKNLTDEAAAKPASIRLQPYSDGCEKVVYMMENVPRSSQPGLITLTPFCLQFKNASQSKKLQSRLATLADRANHLEGEAQALRESAARLREATEPQYRMNQYDHLLADDGKGNTGYHFVKPEATGAGTQAGGRTPQNDPKVKPPKDKKKKPKKNNNQESRK